MLNKISEINPEALKADGFDDAIIGLASRCCMEPVIVYDYDKCVDILIKRDEMSFEEAIEFIEFNVVGTYVGENGPLFLKKYD